MMELHFIFIFLVKLLNVQTLESLENRSNEEAMRMPV